MPLTQNFDEIIMEWLKLMHNSYSSSTCYILLKCMRGNISFCLDWRDICDDEVDCWPDPIDEQNCEKLEQNECAFDEYRCRNGQCIPEENVFDDVLIPDCMDWTDELSPGKTHINEYTCKNRFLSFGCSDMEFLDSQFCSGEITTCYALAYYNLERNKKFYGSIFARTNNQHISRECWATMICVFNALSEISLVCFVTRFAD